MTESEHWLDRNVYLRPVATYRARCLARRATVLGAWACWLAILFLQSLRTPVAPIILNGLAILSIVLIAAGSWVKGGRRDKEGAFWIIGALIGVGIALGAGGHRELCHSLGLELVEERPQSFMGDELDWPDSDLRQRARDVKTRPVEYVFVPLVGIPMVAFFFVGRFAILRKRRAEVAGLLQEADQSGRQRKWDVAVERYSAALNLAPDDEEAQHGLARALQKSGRTDAAQEEYWRYLRHHRKGKFADDCRTALLGLQTERRRRDRKPEAEAPKRERKQAR